MRALRPILTAALGLIALLVFAALPAVAQAATTVAATVDPSSPFLGLLGLGVGATVYDFLRSHLGNCRSYTVTAGVGGLSGGALVAVDAQYGFVLEDTDEGDTVSVVVETDDAGIEYRKANVAFVVGDNVYWDEDGNPVGGTAGTGAMTNTDDTGANPWMGTAVEVAASGATLVRFQKRAIQP